MQLEIIIAVVLLTRKDCLHAWLLRHQNDGFPMGCFQGNLNTTLIKEHTQQQSDVSLLVTW